MTERLMDNSIFVTGATGFLGQYFLKRMQSHPQKDLVLGVRNQEAVPCGLRARVIPYDLNAPIALSTPVAVVLHMAAEKRNAALMYEHNVAATQRLLDWAAKHRVSRFIYLSSVGTYGATHKASVVTAESFQKPRNAYERSKKAAEDRVREVCERLGIEWVILRPSNIVGWNSRSRYPLLGLMRAIQHGQFAYIGQGDFFINYVAAEDVAEALFIVCTQKEASGAFIVNTPARLRDFVEWIARELAVPPPQKHIPRSVAIHAAIACSFLEHVSSHPMPFNLTKYRELTNETIFDGSAIEKIFGFRYPLGWQEMLRRLIAHYRSQGLI